MPWWLTTIFPALLIWAALGFALGLFVMWRRGDDFRAEHDRMRLEAEAESDRLRLRISALKERDQRATQREVEIVELRRSADRVSAMQGQLQEAETKAHLVAALEHQLAKTRGRAQQADQFETELAVLRNKLAAQQELQAEQGAAEARKVGPGAASRAGSGGMREASHSDDLKAINGIGPVMEQTLNSVGIRNWEQIAAFTKADVEKVSAAIEAFPGRIERDDWVGGAQELLAAGHVPGEDTSNRPRTRNRRRSSH